MSEQPCLRSEDGRVFTFYAFISYKHLDMPWGRWVQRRLEGYRLPGQLCEQGRLPSRVSPVFRDETDLSAGETVKNQLKQNLSKCKYLIVICSRHMQQSPEYIDYEIETFLELGNPPGRILPVIVDGEPCSANPAMECFPPALRAMGESRPLGVRVDRRNGKTAILKLVAAMLEIDLQSLSSHEQSRKQRRLIATLSAGFLGSVALGIFLGWQFLRISEARLNEQNVYAASTCDQGDLIRAGEMAEAVRQSANFLMSPEVTEKADRIALLSSLQGKYMPFAAVGGASHQNAVFTADGSGILLYDENTAVRYDTEGRQNLSFGIREGLQGIEAVSPDGVHAVVRTIRSEGTSLTTALWLWDLERETVVGSEPLVSSSHYDLSMRDQGRLDDVVEARFNPDGSLLCAYRIHGYFNGNETLRIFDGKSGGVLAELDGLHLSSRAEGGSRDGELTAFEFLPGRVAHFTGGAYHVFYDVGSGRETRVALADLTGASAVGYGRYRIDSPDGTVLCRDLAEDVRLSFPLPEGMSLCGEKTVFLQGSCAVGLLRKEDGTFGAVWAADFSRRTCGIIRALDAQPCVNLTLSGIPGEKAVCLMEELQARLTGHRTRQLVCMDLDSLETWAIQEEGISLSMDMRALGRSGGRDLICVRGESGTMLFGLSREDSRYAVCFSDESYEDFVSRVVLAGPETPLLLARHLAGWYLYHTAEPGQPLEDSFPVRAISSFDTGLGGNMIACASGKAFMLWQDSKPVAEKEFGFRISSVDLSEDGSRVLIAAGRRIHLLDGQGAELAVSESEENGVIAWAGLTGRSVIALVEPDPQVRSRTDQTSYELCIYSLQDLSLIFRQSEAVYCPDYENPERYVSVSPSGDTYADIELIPVGGENTNFLRRLAVRDAADGSEIRSLFSTIEQTTDVLTGEQTASARRSFGYVRYCGPDRLLVSWGGDVRVLDAGTLEARYSLSDASLGNHVPLLLDNGQLICPGDGFRVWNLDDGRLMYSASARDSLGGDATEGGIFVSADQRWMVVTGSHHSVIYPVGHWTESRVMSLSPQKLMYMDGDRAVLATGDGIFVLPLRDPGRDIR